jgi:DMSO/TMAO reductase YedYZ molybdopterin-dependent catalytic subunit
MLGRVSRAGLFTLFCATLVAAQASPETATLKIGGAVSSPLALTIADLKNLPRKTIHVMNLDEKREETYEGVLLETLLEKAGAPHGEQLCGQLMTSYVVAEGEDGYRVVFALAELDSGSSTRKSSWRTPWTALPLAQNSAPSAWSLRTRNVRPAGFAC